MRAAFMIRKSGFGLLQALSLVMLMFAHTTPVSAEDARLDADMTGLVTTVKEARGGAPAGVIGTIGVQGKIQGVPYIRTADVHIMKKSKLEVDGKPVPLSMRHFKRGAAVYIFFEKGAEISNANPTGKAKVVDIRAVKDQFKPNVGKLFGKK